MAGVGWGPWLPPVVTQGTALTKLDATSITTPLEMTIESGGIDPNAATPIWVWIALAVGVWMMFKRGG